MHAGPCKDWVLGEYGVHAFNQNQNDLHTERDCTDHGTCELGDHRRLGLIPVPSTRAASSVEVTEQCGIIGCLLTCASNLL